MADPGDQAIIERLRARDAAAFDDLYARFNTRLFTFLARLSRDRDRAQDLVEETWLRLVANVDRLRIDTALGPWLFTVARNLYVSQCRARMLEQSEAVLWSQPSREPSPFELTAASESHRRLEAGLASLPLIYREVLLLVGVEGLSIAEAARVCSVSNATLRQRLSRGRAMLAAHLDDGDLAHLRRREVVP